MVNDYCPASVRYGEARSDERPAIARSYRPGALEFGYSLQGDTQILLSLKQPHS
jgi:hypothetical protein